MTTMVVVASETSARKVAVRWRRRRPTMMAACSRTLTSGTCR